MKEQLCAANFEGSTTGKPAKSARVALGSLIIKERLGVSDIETAEQIKENPYLQYFIGFMEYSLLRANAGLAWLFFTTNFH